MWLAGCAMLLMALLVAPLLPPAQAGTGIFFEMPATLSSMPYASAVVNVALIVGIAALMMLNNKLFSYLRGYTMIYVSAFFVLQLATPLLVGALNTGTLLCLMLALGTLALFASYENRHSQGRIYLTMTILATVSMWQWAAVVLIPAFVLGFIDMRAFGFKSLIAALLGLITPFWIVLGLGLVNPVRDFNPLEIHAVWDTLELSQVRLLVGWSAVTVVLAIALTIVNLMTIINYRLQFRVYNAFFIVVTLLCVVAMCVDYHDLALYLPMLNLCLAIQMGHTMTLSTHPKRYILSGSILVVALMVGVSAFLL